MDWYRMYHDARNDNKLLSLTDAQFRVWFRALTFASDRVADKRGTITDCSEVVLAWEVAGGDVVLLRETLARLEELAIVERSPEGGLRFLGWRTRQYVEKPADVATRQAAYREKKKQEAQAAQKKQARRAATTADAQPELALEADPAAALVVSDVAGDTPRKRAPDIIWDVLVELFGEPGTPDERSKRNKAVKQFRVGAQSSGITEEEMVRRIQRAHENWPLVMRDAVETPNGIASNIGILLKGAPKPASRGPATAARYSAVDEIARRLEVIRGAREHDDGQGHGLEPPGLRGVSGGAGQADRQLPAQSRLAG